MCRWAAGTTPRSSRLKASATPCAWNSPRSASASSSSSPAPSTPSGTASPPINLLATSGQGAYAGQAAAVVRVLSAAGLASPPEVIAKAIVRAVGARRPRTRYAVGMGAKPVILARRVLPDRVFDRLLRLIFGIAGSILGRPQADRITAGRAS